jgi:hypothetical protein
MTFRKSADGIAKQGKTVGKNYGDSGPTAKEIMGGKKTKGVTGEAMRKVGRNMARANNQK